MLQAARRTRSVAVELQLPSTPLFVHATKTRLEQVLVNLLHNAIKFSTPGSRVEVKVATSGDEVSVAVRDEGIGIDPDDLARLFEDAMVAY